MRVLYIIHSLPVGGAETLVVNYILKLKEYGIDVCLIERYHTESFLSNKIKDADIPYYTLHKSHNLYLNQLFSLFPDRTLHKLNNLLSNLKPDIIHYHTVFKDLDKVKFPASKIVFTYHSRVERNFNVGRYVRPLIDKMSRKGMKFVAISGLIRQDIERFFPSAKIIDIPNGIDLESIRRHKKCKQYLCDELNISRDSYLLGQVGRFNAVKNHLFTIDLFKSIYKQNKNAHLVLVGAGTNKETEIIKAGIASSGADNNIHLMGLRKDATEIMSCLDTLILPSTSESFSLVLVEAQANNVRCVSSDAVPQDVICNNNCFSLSLEAPKEDWINKIIGDDTHVTGRNIARFDIDNVVRQHINMYHDICLTEQ